MSNNKQKKLSKFSNDYNTKEINLLKINKEVKTYLQQITKNIQKTIKTNHKNTKKSKKESQHER